MESIYFCRILLHLSLKIFPHHLHLHGIQKTKRENEKINEKKKKKMNEKMKK